MARGETTELREQLAAIEHERWADWQRYMFSKCEHMQDGRIVIPEKFATHWSRQIDTPYAELTEQEKDSDREQVDRYWGLVAPHVSPPAAVPEGLRERIREAVKDQFADKHFNRLKDGGVTELLDDLTDAVFAALGLEGDREG